jgi:hypothetical protein
MKSYEELLEEYYSILDRIGVDRNKTGGWSTICKDHLWAASELKIALVAAEEAAFRDYTGTLTDQQEKDYDSSWFATTGGVTTGPFNNMEDAFDDAMDRHTHIAPACYIGRIRPEPPMDFTIKESDLGALGL